MAGQALAPNGTPLAFDGLPSTDFKMVFPKLPMCTMFLQTFSIPGISVSSAAQETRYLNVQNIGEKITYTPFSLTFLLDKNMYTYMEIYNWMQRMTVGGTSVGETDNPYLMLGATRMITFIDAWPMSLDNLTFKADEDDLIYIQVSATFNYDYLVIDGYSSIEKPGDI